jgi:hypothetical protein
MALPSLCVFDLDDCLWTPETYTLSKVPGVRDRIKGPLGSFGEGIIGVRCGNEVFRILFSSQFFFIFFFYLFFFCQNQILISFFNSFQILRLYPGALTVLQHIYMGK